MSVKKCAYSCQLFLSLLRKCRHYWAFFNQGSGVLVPGEIISYVNPQELSNAAPLMCSGG